MTTATNASTETATLHMLRAEVDMRELHRWMGSKRLQDTGHAMHCLLTECFGDLAPKPFRLIVPRENPTGVFYGYSEADATALRAAAAIFADPCQHRILLDGGLDSKPMPAAWERGKRLGFEVRIRPIVRLQKDLSRVAPDHLRRFQTRPGQDDAPRPGKECDVFLWEAMQHSRGGMPRTREEVYRDWLAEQFQRRGGVDLDRGRTTLVSFQRTRDHRKLHARHSEGPDALMRGDLTVTDPAAFAALLARGIGRHRAYGFGMLLLRPPQPDPSVR